MKKSVIYQLAQMAVIRDHRIDDVEKLDIIRELQDKESTALFVENQESGGSDV